MVCIVPRHRKICTTIIQQWHQRYRHLGQMLHVFWHEPLWHVPHLVMCVRRTSRLTALCTADRTTHVPMTPLSLRSLQEQCELGSTHVRPNTTCLCLNSSDSLGKHMLTHLANMMRGGERERTRHTATFQLPKLCSYVSEPANL